MYYLLGFVLVAAAVLAENGQQAKPECVRSEVSSKSREYDDGDVLIEAHKRAIDEIPKAFKQDSKTAYSKVKLEVMQVKRDNRTFTVKRITGFDGSGNTKLNVEYSIYNADKSTTVNTLPTGTFDGLIRECQELRNFKKMYSYYVQPTPMYVQEAPMSNVVYLNDPIRQQLVVPSQTIPQYTVNGGLVAPSWTAPVYTDELVPFGPENANANPQNPQAFGNANPVQVIGDPSVIGQQIPNANSFGQPALGMSNLIQPNGNLPGFAPTGGDIQILGQGQSSAGVPVGGPVPVGIPQGFGQLNENPNPLGQVPNSAGMPMGNGPLNRGTGQMELPYPGAGSGYAPQNSGFDIKSQQPGYTGPNGDIKTITGQDRGKSNTFDNNNMLRPWSKGGSNAAPTSEASGWGQSKYGRVNHLTDGDRKLQKPHKIV
ncbi:hypothetical protein OESDEN_07840 [Oesophagostomum dentatum]|uniref:Uncharacterized protein n=1 Tax=Oesophagostomum dentatum TaxID=61180 RepID=A0A0B1T805_OESDE|nr:hypothetical protein OESDEN_07840 [Oesophagostomum dentatum]